MTDFDGAPQGAPSPLCASFVPALCRRCLSWPVRACAPRGRGYARPMPAKSHTAAADAAAARVAAAAATTRRLLRHDRALTARWVAGTDEVGRGALAGPLVCAAVLFDLEQLRGHRLRPLVGLNDSKQIPPDERERLYLAVLAAAASVAVRVTPAAEIDRYGLGVSNADGLRSCLAAVARPDAACLVDYFKLGPTAPAHHSIVRGDTKSLAIAAASVVAKVTRDRLLQRLDGAYPVYGFSDHVGYGTARHTAALREHGPCPQHRRSFKVAAFAPVPDACR